jgi:hypothetical protein
VAALLVELEVGGGDEVDDEPPPVTPVPLGLGLAAVVYPTGSPVAGVARLVVRAAAARDP